MNNEILDSKEAIETKVPIGKAFSCYSHKPFYTVCLNGPNLHLC